MQIDLSICDHFKVLPTEERFSSLTIYQKLLLYNKIIDSDNKISSIIKNCFEALKPWLDKDMYFNIKEQEENTRINSNWGKQKTTHKQDISPSQGDDILIEE